jgi:hypothetical protein
VKKSYSSLICSETFSGKLPGYYLILETAFDVNVVVMRLD